LWILSIINIGTLSDEPSQEINLSIAKLFASHIGIFGNTGSGKSNTLAKLYSELFKQSSSSSNFKSQSKFVFIDFNGEYTKKDLITKQKQIYNLTTRNNSGDKIQIKKQNIERIEVISVLLEATEKTQKPFLNRAIKNDYLDQDFEIRSRENISKLVLDIIQKQDVDLSVSILTELFGHLKELEVIDENIAENIQQRLESGFLKQRSDSGVYYTSNYYSDSQLLSLIQEVFVNIDQIRIEKSNFGVLKFKILSQFYHEIINGYSNPEHIRPVIGRMMKKFDTLSKVIEIDYSPNSDQYQNLQIVNLKDVNLEMKKTLPLIIVKQLYDEHKDNGDFDKKSLHIIVDEAHNILSDFSERETETWKDYRLETFEEIIKEGRKFSTFLTLSSQRPFDISATIISQLHNYFIHRLINNNDILAIQKTVAYIDKLSFESIPVLPVGSCFVAGLASDIPVKVNIDLLPENMQPRSETINLNTAWF
jgi:energy-coupling factor transporter ATP-binding protein EcfA2